MVTSVSAPSVSSVAASASSAKDEAYAFLRLSNPKLDSLLAALPGVRVWLDAQIAKGSVATGPAAGEVSTPVRWAVWTHSEGTGAKYRHGLTDKQVLEQDIIVVYQIEPNAKQTVGVRENGAPKGRIIALHRMADLPNRYGAVDQGWIATMSVNTLAAAGEQIDAAWSIINVSDAGKVRGGGHPPPRPANHKDGSGAGSAGGEYAGRRWLITSGTSTSVPIIEDDH